jgi:hypothetical protein
VAALKEIKGRRQKIKAAQYTASCVNHSQFGTVMLFVALASTLHFSQTVVDA